MSGIRDFSASSKETTLSEGLERALLLADPSPPPSITDPGKILKRTLSLSSVVSMSSSFTDGIHRARLAVSPQFRIIGLGSCGSVFELPGTELAYKKGPDVDAMWQDFGLTNMVYNALMETRSLLQENFPDRTIPRTPRCHAFLLPTSESWWQENQSRFPQSHRARGAVFLVDRILPLPQLTREALIKKFFEDEEEVQQEALDDDDHKDCLVRIYLGENETEEQENECYDSLRNFPLRLNMIEDLNLAKDDLAVEIAIGLATIHWQAQVDAMDTEFVLGSEATKPVMEPKGYTKKRHPPHEVHPVDFLSRSVHLWILDFDKASEIELTATDVEKKLVPAFLGNDPYYPRPDVDEDLWEVFCAAYLKASKAILESRNMDGLVLSLPRLFLDKVVEMVRLQQNWDPEDEIVFGE